MVCESCGEKPKNQSKNFTKAVIEIDNPEALVLLRKVVIPMSMGDEGQVPPVIGKYRNVVLYYEANKHVYLYSSDGIPTAIEFPPEVLERIALLETGLANEVIAREQADGVLQQEIDDLKNSPDVVDIVATYAALQAYDTSSLGDKDVIRVLVDETHDGQSTYYRWNATPQTWTYIGAAGNYYTKSQIDNLLATTPAFKPFPNSVVTDGTTQQFLNSILALQADTGMAYLGTVSLSDMPAGLIQEEVEVYIYSDYVAYAVMRSTDVSPYAWWCASYNYQGWQPINTDTTYTAGDNIYISAQNVISTPNNYALYTLRSITPGTYNNGVLINYDGNRVFGATIYNEIFINHRMVILEGEIGSFYIVTKVGDVDDGYRYIYFSQGGKFFEAKISDHPTNPDVLSVTNAQEALTAGSNITINGTTISATDTTYSAFGGATPSVAGSAGLVPAPTTSDPDKYLKGDGTWTALPSANNINSNDWSGLWQ